MSRAVRLTVAVTFGCGCAAVVATAVLTELTGAPVAQTFAVFVVRNGASALIGVSVWLRLHDIEGWERGQFSAKAILEAMLIAGCAISAFVWIFWFNPGLPIAFLCLAPATWLALRYSTTVNTLFLAVAGTWIVVATLKDKGVFVVVSDVQNRALIAQAMVCSLTLVVLALSLFRDSRLRLISRLEESRIQADRSSEMFETVLDSIHDSVLLIASSGEIVVKNARADPSMIPEIVSAFRAAPPLPDAASDVVIGTTDDGRIFELTAIPLHHQPELTVVTFRDVTAEHANEQQLRTAALHDPLTGLGNRMLLVSHIEAALADGEPQSFSSVGLLYLDVDGFKTMNDSWGHSAGDDVLRTLARRVQRSIRPGDTAARLGGDEFAVLCPGVCSEEQMRTIADRIRTELQRPLVIGSETHDQLPVSIGIAISHSGITPEQLMHQADTHMYQMKRNGQNRVTQ